MSSSRCKNKDGGWRSAAMRALFDLAQHLINSDQRSIHDLFSGADRDRRHGVVGPVPALGYGFDRREILMVAVAIAEEKKLFHPGPCFQPHRMVTEELARDADERKLSVQQC